MSAALDYVLQRSEALLTPTEELELARLVQARIALLEELGDQQPTRKQRSVLRRGLRAKGRFIKSNLKLVNMVASKYIYACKFLHREDLFQEGCIGLDKAVDRFDPSRGYKFSTYAFWWIRQAVTRAIATKEFSIHMGSNGRLQVTKLRDFYLEFKKEHGRLPSVEEISKALDMPKHWVEIYQRNLLMDTVSLDACASSKEDGDPLGSMIEDKDACSWQHAHQQEQSELIEELFAYLEHECPAESLVLKHRLGLGGLEQLTIREISERYGFNPSSVSTRYAIAKRRLMAYCIHNNKEIALEAA